ncbi:MAG TPA: hypothetical protein VFD55_01305 [Candidatus Angelobacter sp.]|nr:hypothetical protein [Candidatus Angelobacter sp.]
MRNWIISIAIIISAGGALFVAITPQPAFAATACNRGFLGFPAWYDGLIKDETTCDLKSPSDPDVGLSKFIWRIVLNVIEIGLMLAGYIAAFFILYGGFQYMISEGLPEKAVKAKATLLNAVIGLVISIVSVAIINFIVAKVFII